MADTAIAATVAAFAGEKPMEMLLESKAASLKVGLTGGYILDFRLKDDAQRDVGVVEGGCRRVLEPTLAWLNPDA